MSNNETPASFLVTPVVQEKATDPGHDRSRTPAWVYPLGVALVIYLPVLCLGRSFLPLHLQALNPKTAPAKHAPYSTLSFDDQGAFSSEYAYDLYVVNQLRHAHFPCWNGYQGLGQPLAANFIAAPLSPTNLIRLILPHRFWDFVYFVQWLLLGWFTVRLLSLWGLSPDQAHFGGLAIMACGFFQGNLPVRSVVATAMWLPLFLEALTLLQQQKRFSRKGHLLLALATFGLATGGQPEVALLALLTLAVFLGWMCLSEKRFGRALPRALPAILAGGFLAAPVWLTFTDYVISGLARPWHNEVMGLRTHFWEALPAWFFPHAYGLPNRTTTEYLNFEYFGWLPSMLLFLAFFGVIRLFRRSGHPAARALVIAGLVAFAKLMGFPGLQALGDLPFIEKLWFTRFWGFAPALALCVAAAHGLFWFKDLRTPHRVLAILVWTAVAIGLALTGLALVESASLDRTFLVTVIGFGLFWALAPLILQLVSATRLKHDLTWPCLGGAVIAQIIANHPMGWDPDGYFQVNLMAVFCYVMTMALVLALQRRPRWRTTYFGPALMVSLALVLFVTIFRGNFGPPSRRDPLAASAFADFLHEHGGSYRSFGLNGALYPNFGAAAELAAINNLENLLPLGAFTFWREHLDPYAPPFYYAGAAHPRIAGSPSPLDTFVRNRAAFDVVGVRFLVHPAQDPNLIERRGDPNPAVEDRPFEQVFFDAEYEVRIWENPSALPRIFAVSKPRLAETGAGSTRFSELTDPRKAAIVETPITLPASEDPLDFELLSFHAAGNEIKAQIKVNAGSLLVLSEAHMPGWRARLNGEPTAILRVNGALMGVLLPNHGVYDVAFKYRPRSWPLLIVLAIVGVFLLFAPMVRRVPWYKGLWT